MNQEHIKKRRSAYWSAKKLTAMGVLVALHIVANRLLGIDLTPSLRLTISSSFIMLAGLWFGPVSGALVGGLADLVGCVLDGYAPYLLLTVSPVLMGLLAGLMGPVIRRSKNIFVYGAAIALIGILTSVLYSSWSFSVLYGASFWVYAAPRGLQTAISTVLNTLVVYSLYQSPVTALVSDGEAWKSRRAGLAAAESADRKRGGRQ